MLTVKMLATLEETGWRVHEASLFAITCCKVICSLKNQPSFCVNPALSQLCCCQCHGCPTPHPSHHPLLPSLVYPFRQPFVSVLTQDNVELDDVGNCLQKDSFKLVFTCIGKEGACGWSDVEH